MHNGRILQLWHSHNFTNIGMSKSSSLHFVQQYTLTPSLTVKSGMQKIVAISVTEAEVIALVQCVQELIYLYEGIVECYESKGQRTTSC